MPVLLCGAMKVQNFLQIKQAVASLRPRTLQRQKCPWCEAIFGCWAAAYRVRTCALIVLRLLYTSMRKPQDFTRPSPFMHEKCLRSGFWVGGISSQLVAMRKTPGYNRLFFFEPSEMLLGAAYRQGVCCSNYVLGGLCSGYLLFVCRGSSLGFRALSPFAIPEKGCGSL